MKFFEKIYNYWYPEMTLEERIESWCSHIGKDITFGKNMTHEKLDEVGFPRRKFRK